MYARIIHCLLAGLFLQPAFAANKCTDKNGKIFYSDRDCASFRLEHQKTIAAAPSVPSSDIPQQANKIRERMGAASAPFSKHHNSPTIRFWYDAAGQPRAFRTAEAEEMLRWAAAAWSSECNVNLEYAGEVDKGRRSGDSVVRWNTDLPRFGVGATGSEVLGAAAMGGNAAISARVDDAATFRLVAIHEIGHILGIGHNPEDPASVMYPYAGARRQSALSISDKISCNLAMRNRYQVPYELPQGAREFTQEEMANRPRR